MKQLSAVLLLFTVLACSKSDQDVKANRLVGTWRLTTYCRPTGSASCTAVSVPTDKGVYITFDKDGGFNEFYENTKPIDYSFLGCGMGNYTIEGDEVRIMAVCMSSMQGRLMKIVSVANNQLIINPYGTGEYVFVERR